MGFRDIFSFPVTQPFGVPDQSYSGHHTGVDLGLPLGTPVPAEGPGVVESVFQDPIGGEQVKVKYASGAEGWFAHLMTIFVSVGQRVDPQTEIALSGQSGHVTGPHLHFEERDPRGTLIDPTTQAARNYLTGGAAMISGPNDLPAAPTVGENACPAGYSRNVLGICVPSATPGFNPKNPGVDPITGAGPKAVPGGGGIAGVGSDLNPFNAVGAGFAQLGASLDNLRTSVATGTRQLAVAGAVLGVIVVLTRAGAKRILPD